MNNLQQKSSVLQYNIKHGGDIVAKGDSCRICKVNGQRMTIAQRNELMKMEYITTGMTYGELADKYDMSESSVSIIARNGKWKQKKKDFQKRAQKEVEDSTIQVYAGFKAEFVSQYNETWQKLMNIINIMLDNPDKYLKNAAGQYRIGALQAVAEVLQRCQDGQGMARGFVTHEVDVQLKLKQERLELLKKQLGEDSEDIVEDNFIDALKEAAQAVWADEEDGAQ